MGGGYFTHNICPVNIQKILITFQWEEVTLHIIHILLIFRWWRSLCNKGRQLYTKHTYYSVYTCSPCCERRKLYTYGWIWIFLFLLFKLYFHKWYQNVYHPPFCSFAPLTEIQLDVLSWFEIIFWQQSKNKVTITKNVILIIEQWIQHTSKHYSQGRVWCLVAFCTFRNL